MKKLKMLLAIVFAVAVVLGCTPAFAAEAPIQVKSDVPLSKAWSNTEVALSNEVMAAAEYAYMDIDSATPVMQEKILDARNTIIFSQSWTNLAECDGVTVKAIFSLRIGTSRVLIVCRLKPKAVRCPLR